MPPRRTSCCPRRWAAAALAGLVFTAWGPSRVAAHGPKPHAQAEERPELSFGRSDEYDYDPPQPGSYGLPAIKPADDGWVLDTQGQRRRLHALMDGRITVMAFIYTRCSDPQGCPLSLGLLHDLLYVGREDPAIGDNLRLIALSFDVEHDTPEVMAEFAGDPAAHGEAQGISFLTTRSQDELKPILEAYDQPIGRKADAEDPFGPFTHQLRVFLIDRERRIRNIYSLGFLDPRLVITDIRTLLLEERGQEPEG